MQIIEVRFSPWDQSYYFKPETTTGEFLNIKKGDKVVVETILGIDLADVIELGELAEAPTDVEEIKPIIRLATPEDILKSLELNKNRKEFLGSCRELAHKQKLEMKVVDAHASFDGNRLVFAFIADGRIDFRELVKELTKKYQKNIRMQQIGVRDEAKIAGDVGACGRCLCCLTCLKELGNVSTDCAKLQSVAHRGADRLSGVCGRLKCCLRYEQPVYEMLAKKFPAVGSSIKTKNGQGTVISWQLLKGTVRVDVGDEKERNIIEVPVK